MPGPAIVTGAAHAGNEVNMLMAMNTGTARATPTVPSSAYSNGSGSDAVITRVVIPRRAVPHPPG